MKVYIFYTLNDTEWEFNLYTEYLNSLPEHEAECALKYRRWQDKQAHILGRLLLQRGLIALSFINKIEDIKFSRYGKPYFEFGPFFNISHSGKYVLCSISDIEIGIDIEEIKKVDIKTFGNIFSNTERTALDKLVEDLERQMLFFNIWTKKEAIVKAYGEGISMKLNAIDTFQLPLILKNKVYVLHELALSSAYSCHIAHEERQNVEIEIKALYF